MNWERPFFVHTEPVLVHVRQECRAAGNTVGASVQHAGKTDGPRKVVDPLAEAAAIKEAAKAAKGMRQRHPGHRDVHTFPKGEPAAPKGDIEIERAGRQGALEDEPALPYRDPADGI